MLQTPKNIAIVRFKACLSADALDSLLCNAFERTGFPAMFAFRRSSQRTWKWKAEVDSTGEAYHSCRP